MYKVTLLYSKYLYYERCMMEPKPEPGILFFCCSRLSNLDFVQLLIKLLWQWTKTCWAKSRSRSRGAFKSPEPIKKGPASQHCLYKYTCWRNLKFVHVKKSLFSVPIRGSNLLIASFLTPMHSLYNACIL